MIFTCNCCGKEFPEDKKHYIDFEKYCESCYNEALVRCYECGEEHEPNEVEYIEVNGETVAVCAHCLDDFSECSLCGEYMKNGEHYHLVPKNGKYIDICESCKNKYYTNCDLCGGIVENGKVIPYKDFNFCLDCFGGF